MVLQHCPEAKQDFSTCYRPLNRDTRLRLCKQWWNICATVLQRNESPDDGFNLGSQLCSSHIWFARPVLQTRAVFTSHPGFHLAELLNDGEEECLSQSVKHDHGAQVGNVSHVRWFTHTIYLRFYRAHSLAPVAKLIARIWCICIFLKSQKLKNVVPRRWNNGQQPWTLWRILH